jgi:ribonuclease III
MNAFAVQLGYEFGDGAVLEVALTHRSYTAEHEGAEHNERMEFLGDAVLEFVVTDLLYERFREMREGEMAKLRASLVSREVLAAVARDVGVGDFLRLGRGEETSDGRNKDSILADAMEALIAAVYLDGGVGAAREVILRHWERRVAARSVAPGGKDYKTRLQEVLARAHLEPVYRVRGEGPDHDRVFTATVEVGGAHRGEGRGRSKKGAEQEAARVALQHMTEGDLVAVRATVHGRVQGVGFRYSTIGKARGVVGWVKNLPSGDVEVHAQGARTDVDALLDWIEVGPASAVVRGVDRRIVDVDPHLDGFTIR